MVIEDGHDHIFHKIAELSYSCIVLYTSDIGNNLLSFFFAIAASFSSLALLFFFLFSLCFIWFGLACNRSDNKHFQCCLFAAIHVRCDHMRCGHWLWCHIRAFSLQCYLSMSNEPKTCSDICCLLLLATMIIRFREQNATKNTPRANTHTEKCNANRLELLRICSFCIRKRYPLRRGTGATVTSLAWQSVMWPAKNNRVIVRHDEHVRSH